MVEMNARILASIFEYLKNRPTIESIGIESYRQLLEKGAAAFKPDETVRFDAFTVNNIPCEFAVPENDEGKSLIVYVHGGGYIAGSINSHRELGSRIARYTGSKLLLFDYRLAPEHPFPEGLEDVQAVYQWVLDRCDPGTSIALVGDSAGGGLALTLVSLLLKNKARLPACLCLMSPWIDLECKNDSHTDDAIHDPMLNQAILEKTARFYTDRDLSDPMISPINNDFSGICPVLIQVGGHEVLLDDSKKLHEKLKTISALVTLEVWDEMFHVWQYFSRYLKEGRDAVRSISNFIQKHQ